MPFPLGSIVIVRFPFDDIDPDVPSNKPRPCLSLGPYGGNIFVAAFGTDFDHDTNVGPDDLIVWDPADLIDCRLEKPTRFCLNRIRPIPATPYWMDVGKGAIATLPDHLVSVLKRKMQRAAKRGRTVQHAAPVLALLMDKPGQRLACGATLELRPHCATVRLDDFTAEFWFDDELTVGGDLLELTRATPLLTAEEKEMALDVLLATRAAAAVGMSTDRKGRPAA